MSEDSNEDFRVLPETLKEYLHKHPINQIKSDREDRWMKYHEIEKQTEQIIRLLPHDAAREANMHLKAYLMVKLRLTGDKDD